MKLLIKSIFYSLLINVVQFSFAQEEYVTELSVNPDAHKSGFSVKSSSTDTLSLPFFDDFSYPYNTLNSNFWQEGQVFVNNSYSRNPVSTGIATFDILDESGKVYTNASVNPFYADQLTSKAIDLEGKLNVYLSFFYQPQGLGDQPEEADSLMLLFKTQSNEWVNVWSVPGQPYHEFKQVILALDEEQFLYNGFQFRFINKASITKEAVPGLKTNSDHWNIDYIFLDENRSMSDTTYNDVVFSQRIGSVLENYSTVPWKHFPNARNQELKRKRITLHVKNLNQNTLQVDIRYLFQDVLNPSHKSIYTYNPANLQAGEDTTFIEDIDFDFILSESEDSAHFLIKTNLINIDNEFNRDYNDTIVNYQVFKDYYAYDDGTEEAGYGFRGIGSEVAQLAYFYNTYKPDSLIAIDILFNPTLKDTIHGQNFWLTVWDFNEDSELPGNILYEKVEWVKAIKKGFIRYPLENPIYLTDKFFIGWQQIYSNYLNIGYDRNRNNRENTFINFNGFWQNSGETGTLMIRPVFGERKNLTGIYIDEQKLTPGNRITVYPNPVSNNLHVHGLDKQKNWNIQVYDITGKMVVTHSLYDSFVNLESLEKGIYLVKIISNSGESYTRKIAVSR